MMKRARIILKPAKANSLKRYHPWIFSGAIKSMDGSAEEGDVVDVHSDSGEFLGTGHYAGGSIAVRIISFEPANDIGMIITDRIKNAYEYRKEVGLADHKDTNVYRLVNAEGDGIPGLIVDYYDGMIVTQFHSTGMYREKEKILASMEKVLGTKIKKIIDRSEFTLPSRFVSDNKIGTDGMEKGRCEVSENGNHFIVDLHEGQKTGFYIDQRENRKLLGTLSSGRSVLNLFGYTGGFSVYALKGGAKLVHTVDSSAGAVDLAKQNIHLNFGNLTPHDAFCGDVSKFLQNPGGSYDLIISDPPAFAKHQNTLENALQGYKRLNARIFEMIRPGGIVFTFSCSQVVTKENFRKSIFAAAANARRKIRIMHQLSQPPDHPVSIYHPEGEYLKGLVLYVE
jgi:23S rRNA (cytosine1962-C5)-methyltransferase